MRRTKIVATIGPASWEEPVLKDLMAAGLDVARLNFSHGDHALHARTLDRVRRTAAASGRPVAVLQDLGGPKIRCGVVAGDGAIALKEGETVILAGGDETARAGRIGVSYGALAAQCRAGARVFMDDGLIELRVEACRGAELVCTVVRGGELRSRKGVNVPGASFGDLPALTVKDRADLEWGLAQGVDYVGLSFVRKAADILEVRRIIDERKGTARIVAKIEKPQALENLEAIVEAADAVMIARGDLGVELDPEQVPLVQKDIIRLANARERPVITATQMLESMTRAARPTRAEVSDVANAIFDGTDAVMLSGETAGGAHPVAALRMMARIAEAADEHILRNPVHRRRADFAPPDTVHEAIGRAAELVARELDVKVIVAATMDGSCALGISKSRPDAALLALTPDATAFRRMAIYWGVQPLMTTPFRERSELIRVAEREAVKGDLAKEGDLLVLVTSTPPGTRDAPNNLRLHQIGAARTGETRVMMRPSFDA